MKVTKITLKGLKASLFDWLKMIVNVDMNCFVKHIFHLTKKYYRLKTAVKCVKKCDCKSDLCSRRHEYFKTENEDSASDSEDVSDKEKQIIRYTLVFYKSQMSADCITDFEVVHGLTNEVLN